MLTYLGVDPLSNLFKPPLFKVFSQRRPKHLFGKFVFCHFFFLTNTFVDFLFFDQSNYASCTL